MRILAPFTTLLSLAAALPSAVVSSESQSLEHRQDTPPGELRMDLDFETWPTDWQFFNYAYIIALTFEPKHEMHYTFHFGNRGPTNHPVLVTYVLSGEGLDLTVPVPAADVSITKEIESTGKPFNIKAWRYDY